MPLKHWKFLLPAALVLILLSYFYLDAPIARYFQTLPSSWHRAFVYAADIASPWWHVVLWLVVYYILRFHLRLTNLTRKTILIAISINVANACGSLLKILIGRSRPDLPAAFHPFALSDFNYQSFPSSHALTITVLMSSLGCLYPRLFPLFFLFAALISFCRLATSVHYLSDILGGMALGLFAAHFVYLSMRKEIKFH
jgi:undecaprenyl-diphosphatase